MKSFILTIHNIHEVRRLAPRKLKRDKPRHFHIQDDHYKRSSNIQSQRAQGRHKHEFCLQQEQKIIMQMRKN